MIQEPCPRSQSTHCATPRQVALSPHDRPSPVDDAGEVQIRLPDLTLHRSQSKMGEYTRPA